MIFKIFSYRRLEKENFGLVKKIEAQTYKKNI